MIKDSGNRTEFVTGAVRDMKKGVGRMDLLPWYGIMEVSKHCEEGAEKYGEHNVDKGIPLHSLCDSAARHLAKFIAGEMDEDHLRAACWNLLWALNQRKTHPELDDLYSHKEIRDKVRDVIDNFNEPNAVNTPTEYHKDKWCEYCTYYHRNLNNKDEIACDCQVPCLFTDTNKPFSEYVPRLLTEDEVRAFDGKTIWAIQYDINGGSACWEGYVIVEVDKKTPFKIKLHETNLETVNRDKWFWYDSNVHCFLTPRG